MSDKKETLSPLEELVALIPELDPKHQVYVLRYIKNGLNDSRAYAFAYPDNKTPGSGAWQLRAKNSKVARAIDLVHETIGMGKRELVARLATYARATWDPFFDEKGKLDLSTEEAQAAMHTVSEIHVTDTKHGQSVRLKLEDRQAALDKIARLGGMYDDSMTLTHEYSEEKAREVIKDMLGTNE